MRKKLTLGITVGVLIFGLCSDVLAGQYDGTYTGELIYQAGGPGTCKSPRPMVMSIKDQKVQWGERTVFNGTLQNDGSFAVSGVISRQGKQNFYDIQVKIEGKAGNGKVVGTLSEGSPLYCKYTFDGTRS